MSSAAGSDRRPLLDYLPQDGSRASRGRFKGFSGAIGSGKNAPLCFETIREAYLNRGSQGVLAAPTFAMLRDEARVASSNPEVLDRVHKVNALLRNALGEVRLEVNPKCKELVKDFEEVMFKPDSGVIDKCREPLRTHTSDALGYLVWQLFGDKPAAGEMDKPLL